MTSQRRYIKTDHIIAAVNRCIPIRVFRLCQKPAGFQKAPDGAE